MSTWVDFRELRSKVRIADVLERHHVPLKIKGDRATGFCPLPGHKSKSDDKRHSPSFSVNLSRNLFNCFSCGGAGNAIDLHCFLDGGNPKDPTSLRESALKLQESLGLSAERPGRTSRPSDTRSASVAVEPVIQEEPDPSGPFIVNAALDFELKHLDAKHPYLRSRGLMPATIEHFGLGYCDRGLMAERIAIPLHNGTGTLIGYAGRVVDDDKVSDANPKYRFPGARKRKDTTCVFRKSEFLYNGHRIAKPVSDLIVVEGFASVWWLWEHGYKDVVALMGNSVSAMQGELLHELLGPEGRLWILSDADAGGEQGAQSLFASVAPCHFVRWVKLGQGQPTDLSERELSTILSSL
jgi:DNA primase